MRIGSHYRTPGPRLLPAVLTLVYLGVLTGGLFAHMVDEGDELRTLAAAVEERHPGDPLPWSDDAPDDLDCLLCQVLGSPGHPAPDASPVAVSAAVETLRPPEGVPARDAPSHPRQARAPPVA